jgi:hypothetical protein
MEAAFLEKSTSFCLGSVFRCGFVAATTERK